MKNKKKNLVFDLGGVILPLNRPRAEHAFAKLNPARIEQATLLIDQERLFYRFEMGEMSEQVFLDRLISVSETEEARVRKAWDAILEPIPGRHMNLLSHLAEQYNLYLLSNTNSLHMAWIEHHLAVDHAMPRFGGVFTTLFLSFEMGTRKPHPDIYALTQNQIGCTADEIWFVDDNLDNVQAARTAGWEAVLHPANDPLENSVSSLLEG